MRQNKGKRTQAKLMLNNLWGRFSLRNWVVSMCNYRQSSWTSQILQRQIYRNNWLRWAHTRYLAHLLHQKERLDWGAQLLQCCHLFMDNIRSANSFASCHAESCSVFRMQTTVHRHRLTNFCSSNQQLSSTFGTSPGRANWWVPITHHFGILLWRSQTIWSQIATEESTRSWICSES